MSDTLLDAGAIVAGPPGSTSVDTVTARSYLHPALTGCTVVRLVGATLGPAEDLTMEFLGFTRPADPVPVGHARRQALGFPAWALVHDPANGRHALALIKEMEKLARTARQKPGNAKDGYDALAVRLGGAAPQFLPTFWEQAGRAFIAAENPRAAGTCFTEARRAEQVHGLVVDEDRIRDVHLEFAFAGGLTAAMLAEYTRGVVDRRPAAEAYDLVRALAVRRVAGGLPPHASMATDLARLARAAGLDPDREAEDVVAQLLTYPATGRAHPTVWTSYRRALVRLADRDDATRARLLTIVPEPPGYGTDMTDQWLELLEASGAITDLITSRPHASGAGRWLDRILAGRRSGWRGVGRSAALLSIVERLVPRLIAEGGLHLDIHPWHAEPDVIDACLAGGVPVEFEKVHTGSTFDISSWARDDNPGRRDLSAIAADPVLRPILRRSAAEAIGRLREGSALTSPALPVATLRHAFGAAGVHDVLLEYLAERATATGDETVAGLDAVLTDLAPLWSPAGMALAADGFRGLTRIDVAAVLARTLRAGVLAELGWPAYDAAARQAKGVRTGTSWPELVVHDRQMAHVIAPDGSTTQHVFRLPPAGHRQAPHTYAQIECFSVDGELLVTWTSPDGPVAYWSSRPDDLIDGGWSPHPVLWGVAADPLPVPGGGITTGVRPVHAGDVSGPPEMYPLAGDGQAYWRCERVPGDSGRHEWQWREFDPRTGNDGRVSVPAFFAAAGGTLLSGACRLRPVPDEFAASPLGTRGGLAGWRTVRTPDGGQAGAGVDGREVTLQASTGVDRDTESLVGAVLLPGAAAALPVTRSGRAGQGQVRVWTADGTRLLAQHSESTATLPPLEWWHAMRPRDEAGSAALRELDEQTAAALLAIDDAVTGTVKIDEVVTALVTARLPTITDTTLRARVVEVVARAIRLRRRIAQIPQHLQTRPDTTPAEVSPVSDEALRLAWDGLADNRGVRYHSGSAGGQHQVLDQIARTGAALGSADPGTIPPVSPTWVSLLSGPGAVALRAAAPTTGPADREALTAFLTAIAGTPLAGDGPPLRVLFLAQDTTSAAEVEVRRGGAEVTVLFEPVRHYQGGVSEKWRRTAVQVAPDGAFTVPDGLTLRDETRPGGRLTGERLRTFCTLLAERGPVVWRPDAAERLSEATGMTPAEAKLLLAGLPGLAHWEANFLTTEQRTTIGITAAQAKVARATLRELTIEHRIALLDAAMPADPADLWEHGPDVEAVARTWIGLRGRRIAVPDHLLTELARLVDDSLATPVLQAIVAPTVGDWLSTDGRSSSRGYHVVTEAGSGTPFEGSHLDAAATALAWLAYRLSWDDPLRVALPVALRLVRDRLCNPHLIVGRGWHPDAPLPDAGPALVEGAESRMHHLVPALLAGADDPAIGFIDDATADALRILLSGWIDDVVSTPDGAAGDPHDPRVAAPDLVGEAAARFEVDSGAAAYYLQLLALPDPTDKAVQVWNGWKPAQLRKAREALVATGLVVAAKRERAGRQVFLPGGWQPVKAPALPLETWKLPMYAQTGRLLLVTRPLPQQFAFAWARITSGDLPRYHDLEEKP